MQQAPSIRRARRLVPIVAAAVVVAALATVTQPPRAGHDRGGPRLASLASQAGSRGSVRVIVGLESPARPEGAIRDRLEVLRQRAGIAAIRERLLERLPAGSMRARRDFQTIPYVALEVDAEGLAALSESDEVASITEDAILFPLATGVTAGAGPIHSPSATYDGFDGSGWSVAILDTGVQRDHPYLGGRVVSEACYSFKRSCPDASKSQKGVPAGRPCTWSAGCWHGTHVAGIAAGLGGVASGANIIAIQVFSRFEGTDCIGAGENPCAGAATSDVVAALERVYDLRRSFRIGAANLSLGGRLFDSQAACDADAPSMKAVIETLRSVGIATVAASGNDGRSDRIATPACITGAISVGSSNSITGASLFSNVSTFLSLLAPGEGLTSSVPPSGFTTRSGTSMAAPHVAGAWAVRMQSNPDSTMDEAQHAFTAPGFSTFITWAGFSKPRLNIFGALFRCEASAVPDSGDPPMSVTLTATSARGSPPIDHTWDFDDGTTAAAGALVEHAFEYSGVHTVTLQGRDAKGLTCSASVGVQLDGPSVSRVRTKGSPFRLVVDGSGFAPGAAVLIDGVAAPLTKFVGPTRLVAYKGSALKSMLPDAIEVSIQVRDPGGVTSRGFPFTR